MPFVVESDSSCMTFLITSATCHIELVIEWQFWHNDMNSCELMKTWHCQWWKNNWIISRSRKSLRRNGMENAWGIIFLCCICSPPNFGYCYISNWSKKSFKYCKYLYKPLMLLVGLGQSWNAYKHLQKLTRWCSGWWFDIHGAIHGNGISLNERKWKINRQAWAFGIEWKQTLCKI